MSTEQSLARIREQNERIRAIARAAEPRLSIAAPAVSGWSVAEHLDHTVKVTASVVRRVNQPDAEPSPSGINFLGRMILLFGRIPRGRGKSPERLAGTRAKAEEIEAGIARLEEWMGAVDVAACDASRLCVVPHPRFGGLTPTQALRFAAIHADHHLKIVDEILKTER